MSRILAAISGGVDSASLLHMLSGTQHKVIVAHVDHGIRPESAADARFVKALAESYGYPYVSTELHLGEKASEEQARAKRYEFLFRQAAEYSAEIMTAHHGDDLVETIAINLRRGTGWRGLAVLGRAGIRRPLLPFSKSEMYDYATKHRLEWVEDSTNTDRRYLRNDLRAHLSSRVSPEDRQTLKALRDAQLTLKQAIGVESAIVLALMEHRRHFLTQLDTATAVELLSEQIVQDSGTRPTRPQAERALLAIKTAKAGTRYEVGSGVTLGFTSRHFSVEVLS